MKNGLDLPGNRERSSVTACVPPPPLSGSVGLFPLPGCCLPNPAMEKPSVALARPCWQQQNPLPGKPTVVQSPAGQ
ncbi:hypothetical protein ATANTOWER_025400 [Ataeniobius toweri]|uniref:Uncharacterized protein n=1 Tax=Ataeniobius toweri TaxID=208326 RepID=A0ABU7BRG7_9TELE|nr:hypothetical protein [Ataeniobius toweri]